MFTKDEREEIRQAVWHEVATLEHAISRQAGSYRYLCLIDGGPTFTHKPHGAVLRRIYHVGEE